MSSDESDSPHLLTDTGDPLEDLGHGFPSDGKYVVRTAGFASDPERSDDARANLKLADSIAEDGREYGPRAFLTAPLTREDPIQHSRSRGSVINE